MVALKCHKSQIKVEDMMACRRLIGACQLDFMLTLLDGEEGQLFFEKIAEIGEIFRSMPRVYGQDGKGDEAIVYLHYFVGSADWWITERDVSEAQHQAYGLADLFQDGGEKGYISIPEITRAGAELDLYWKPKTLGEVKERRGR